jgi:hypothetical protein
VHAVGQRAAPAASLISPLISQDYFADLQEDMVSIIALTEAMLGYLWLATGIWVAYLAKGDANQVPGIAAWIGAGVLLGSAILSNVWRRSHLRLALPNLVFSDFAGYNNLNSFTPIRRHASDARQPSSRCPSQRR